MLILQHFKLAHAYTIHPSNQRYKKLLHFSTPHYKYIVYGTKDLLLSPLTIIKHPILDMIFLITYQNKAPSVHEDETPYPGLNIKP